MIQIISVKTDTGLGSCGIFITKRLTKLTVESLLIFATPKIIESWSSAKYYTIFLMEYFGQFDMSTNYFKSNF